MKVLFKRIHEDAIAPTRAYPGDAGWDLHSTEDLQIVPGMQTLVPSGLVVAVDPGYCLTIKGRSSAWKKGLFVVEGLIDAGYRGELFASVWNVSNNVLVNIRKGDSLAQMVISRVEHVEWFESHELPPSTRGEQGFGSSGR